VVDVDAQVTMYQNMAQYLRKANLNEYYTYPGSLTTPGCFEAVTWMVFKDVYNMKEKIVREIKEHSMLIARGFFD
jgi:carbonic anhydrase